MLSKLERIPERPAPRPKPPGVVAGPYANQIIVRMKERADLTQEAMLPRGPERRVAVWNDLVATADRTQAPVRARLDELAKQGLVSSYKPLYLPNALVVTLAPGKQSAVADALRGLGEISGISENRTWRTTLPLRTRSAVEAVKAARAGVQNIAMESSFGTPEWGVAKIGAPQAWAKGYTGAGVTVGVVDTGLDAEHPAIKGHYRGTNADGSVDHNYNWYDATAQKATPYDDGEHGTHVAGTVAGGTGERAIGVAPGARIIAAKALLRSGLNTTVATLEALQWMLAPTDTQGRNPDPRRGADIVNNSWGNADQADATFIDTWNGLLAAGVIPVSAAGNSGPGQGTVSPPGSYPMGISVAATNSSDKVTGFSSRGPSKFDPKAVVPLLAAPGGGVTSSVPGGRYSRFDGTSMASPHVAGAVALMLQAKPTATYDEIVAALTSTATDIDAPGPDRGAGYGRINVDRAIDALLAGTTKQVANRAA